MFSSPPLATSAACCGQRLQVLVREVLDGPRVRLAVDIATEARARPEGWELLRVALHGQSRHVSSLLECVLSTAEDIYSPDGGGVGIREEGGSSRARSSSRDKHPTAPAS